MDWFFPSFFGQVQQAVQQAAGDLLGPSFASCGTSSCSSPAALAAGEMTTPIGVLGPQSGADLIIGRNLGPKEGLESLTDEFKYNKDFGAKVKMLENNNYTHWRRVRGDGNCFWRSVGFGLLEHFIASPAPVRSKLCQDLIQRLSTVKYDHKQRTLDHKDLLARLERLRSGQGWEEPTPNTPANGSMKALLYSSMQCPENPADLALIRALRHLTSCFIIDHGDDHTAATSGISFRDVSLCTGFNGIEDFVNRVVLPEGIEAETLCQAALPSALGIIVRIAMLDSASGNTEVQFIDFGATSEEADDDGQVILAKVQRPMVHVQFRPGHYDLLYLSEKVVGPSHDVRAAIAAPAAATPPAAMTPPAAAFSVKSEAEAKALRRKERHAAREAKRAAAAAASGGGMSSSVVSSSVVSSSVGSSSIVSSGVGSSSVCVGSSGVGSGSFTSSGAGGSCFGSVRSQKSKERPALTATAAAGKVRLPTLGMEMFENEFEVVHPLASAPQGTKPTSGTQAPASAAVAAAGSRSHSKGTLTPRKAQQGACF